MTTYLYRVRARNATGVSEWTTDHATTVVFTDPVLTPGATTVKEDHLTELRQAVSAVRVAAGTNVTTWDEEPLPETIKASHVAQLRSKLNEGLDALGVSTVTFTDGTLSPQGSFIKAVHIQQLRQGVE